MIEGLLGPRGDWVDLFQACTWSAGLDLELPYRFFDPGKLPPGGRFPLVLFLHGAGERGNNNRSQLRHGVRRFVLPASRAQYPAFILAPQCPAGDPRTSGYWLREHPRAQGQRRPDRPVDLLSVVVDLTRRTLKQYPVDPGRVYVTGISMGGFGTWALMAMEPDLFAAAIPVCGGGNPGWAPRIKRIPVWAFHGEKDTVVPVEYTRAMISALQAEGAQPRYTEYPGVGHDSWTAAYQEPELLEWLFAQGRGRSPAS